MGWICARFETTMEEPVDLGAPPPSNKKGIQVARDPRMLHTNSLAPPPRSTPKICYRDLLGGWVSEEESGVQGCQRRQSARRTVIAVPEAGRRTDGRSDVGAVSGRQVRLGTIRAASSDLSTYLV